MSKTGPVIIDPVSILLEDEESAKGKPMSDEIVRTYRKVPVEPFLEAVKLLGVQPNELAYELGYSAAGTALGWQKAGEFPMVASLALKTVLESKGKLVEEKDQYAILIFSKGKLVVTPTIVGEPEKLTLGGKDYIAFPAAPATKK